MPARMRAAPAHAIFEEPVPIELRRLWAHDELAKHRNLQPRI